jgi:hypothetical protein
MVSEKVSEKVSCFLSPLFMLVVIFKFFGETF